MFDRRGVSEALGFVFVFGIIITMTGIVYVTGFEDLQNTRDFEQGNNAQRAFDVLRSNVQDISQRGAPSRGTEVKLSDARIASADPVKINVTVAESGNLSNNASLAPDFRPITYETDDSAIVYVNGAIFRESPGGVTMVQHPEFVLTDDRVFVSIIETYPGNGPNAITGSRTVLVRTLNDHADGLPDVMAIPDVDQYNVTISMETPRASSWEEYFEEEGLDCDRSGDRLDCWIDGVEQARITRILVKVVLE